MAVVDPQQKIIYASCGSPGSYHDARVFRRSPLAAILDTIPEKYHLLGNILLVLTSQLTIYPMTTAKQYFALFDWEFSSTATTCSDNYSFEIFCR